MCFLLQEMDIHLFKTTFFKNCVLSLGWSKDNEIMAKLYLISTFSPLEMKEYSTLLFAQLRQEGIECLEPSFSGKIKEGLLEKEEIFKSVCADVRAAGIIIFISHNETADWGALLGYAFALKKKIIILSEKDNLIPFMAARMKTDLLFVDQLSHSNEYVDKLVALIKKK